MRYWKLFVALGLWGILANGAWGAGGGEESAAVASSYFELDPPFVVNVQDGGRMRFMQVKVQLRTGGPEVNEAVEAHMPAVRHAMIMLLAHQEASAIRKPAGREQVRQQAAQAIQSVLAQNAGQLNGVEAVYFTDFVIQ